MLLKMSDVSGACCSASCCVAIDLFVQVQAKQPEPEAGFWATGWLCATTLYGSWPCRDSVTAPGAAPMPCGCLPISLPPEGYHNAAAREDCV